MRFFGIFLLIVSILYSCTGEKDTKETEATAPIKTAEKEKQPEKVDPFFAEGKKNYQKNCMTCHMHDGYGVPNLNPPLAETDWVNGDEERLIDIVLNGREGEIEVNGEIYNGVMIPHSHLSDKVIASILTYIRASFGNKSGPISEDQVASVRAKP
ncbi:MAG: cytochrome c [Bacteroidota bacterium]